jgi:hypothetical protein
MKQRRSTSRRSYTLRQFAGVTRVIFEALEDRTLLSSAGQLFPLHLDRPGEITTGPTEPAFVLQTPSAIDLLPSFPQTAALARILPVLSQPSAAFTGSINWGDQQSSPPSITPDPQGGFDVTAAHTFTTAGTYDAVLTITGMNTTVAAKISLIVGFANAINPPLSANMLFVDSAASANAISNLAAPNSSMSQATSPTQTDAYSPDGIALSSVADQSPSRANSTALALATPPGTPASALNASPPAALPQQVHATTQSVTPSLAAPLTSAPLLHPAQLASALPASFALLPASPPPLLGDPGTFSGELTLAAPQPTTAPDDPQFEASANNPHPHPNLASLDSSSHSSSPPAKAYRPLLSCPVAVNAKLTQVIAYDENSPNPPRLAAAAVQTPPIPPAVPTLPDRPLLNSKFVLAGLLAMTTVLALPFTRKPRI